MGGLFSESNGNQLGFAAGVEHPDSERIAIGAVPFDVDYAAAKPFNVVQRGHEGFRQALLLSPQAQPRSVEQC
jgi:hypothetical protein